MKDNIRILSTAKLDEALIEQAAYKHIIIDAVPFIEIKKLLTAPVRQQVETYSGQPAIIAFTSMNAVETIVELLPSHIAMPPWKFYCTGGATFTLIKKYWPYESIVYTAKNATDLANKMIADDVQDCVFFCGNLRREELPDLLEKAAIKLHQVVVYETIETPVVINENYNAILFFSPSAVTGFFACNHIGSGTVLFAIGQTTAAAIRPFSGNEIVVSNFPAKDLLAGEAIAYFS